MNNQVINSTCNHILVVDRSAVSREVVIGAIDASQHPDKSLNELIKLADNALYAAKQNGRNRIYISMDKESVLPVEEAAPIISVGEKITACRGQIQSRQIKPQVKPS